MSRQQKCLSSSKAALLVTANILANWADFLVTLHDDRLGCDIEVAQLVGDKNKKNRQKILDVSQGKPN